MTGLIGGERGGRSGNGLRHAGDTDATLKEKIKEEHEEQDTVTKHQS